MNALNGERQPRDTVELAQEMQVAYLDYAMSVIVSRALPDVRDGLKPVQRRILYAMFHDLHLQHTGPYRKSARIVGEVLGKYHPHSDQSVYDAMVRLAQDFSLRYPLVDGQGNLGSVDGDNPAAMRYTEARLSAISALMLEDLTKDAVAWNLNFDNSLQEPAVLSTALPNLLVNGANGIAVGMATQIPPHNLGEVCDALCHLIDQFDRHPDVTIPELMDHIKGPDFPTGGRLFRFAPNSQEDRLRAAYASGSGRVTVRAKVHIEAMRMGRSRIVVTQLPYLTNKAHLIERTVQLVRQGSLSGISDIRDESDRAGMRICIELTRTALPQKVLSRLFTLTPMEQTCSLAMVALVNDRPLRLNLKEILLHFIEHRTEIVRRRSEFDLRRARERLHVVEGLLAALDQLDDVIRTIRRSRRPDTARTNLMKTFKFTQAQARAILAMPLRQLVGLEIRQLRDERQSLSGTIRELEDLLGSDAKIRDVIQRELEDIKERFGDSRRTLILNEAAQTPTDEDLEPDQTVWVALGRRGAVKRYAYRGMGSSRFREIGRNSGIMAVTANTRDMLYLFSADGKCQRVQIFRVPQSGSPTHVADLTGFTRRDAIVAALPLPRDSHHGMTEHVCLISKNGQVKRIPVQLLIEASGEELQPIRLAKGDKLGWVLLSNGGQSLMLFTARGKAIHFPETDVRARSLATGGVGGMKIAASDCIVDATLTEKSSTILSITRQGYIKRTPVSEYTLQSRAGSGLISHKLTSQEDDIVAGLSAKSRSEGARIAVRAGRKTYILTLTDIPESGRMTLGRRVALQGQEGTVDSATLIWSDSEAPGRPGRRSRAAVKANA